MLDKIPAIMIDPAVVIDTRCDPAGLRVVFSDGTSKVLTCVGGGGGPTPTPAATITVNGGQTANVTPSSNLSVRVQGVAAGTSIQWAGTGTSVSDPLIASLTSLAGSASSADFTVNVPVSTAQRVITFTASVGGTQVAAFTVTVAATATDFQISAPASLNFASGSTTAQQASISLTNLVGNPGAVSVTVSAGSAPVTVSPTSLSLSQSTTSGTVNITPAAGAAAGSYSVTVTATNGTTTRTATISVAIAAAAPSFTLSVSPASLNFASGSTTAQQASISLTNLVGNPGAVSVTVSAGSAPVTVSPTSLSLSQSTPSGTVTVTPTAGAASGTYSVTVTATNGTTTRTATISVVIAAVDTDFRITASGPLSFAGGSTTGQQSTLSLTSIVGLTGTVSVTVSAGSAPVAVSPASLLLSATTTTGSVTVTPTSGAAAGTYSLTVTAVSGTTTRTATISVVIAAAADFQITASGPLSLTSGSTTGQQSLISLSGIVGDPGTVSVSVAVGSAPVTVNPVLLALSLATPSGAVTVTPTSGAAAGTYSLTVTATRGTTTRTTSISVVIAAAPIVYGTPTLQILYEAGMPTGEVSLDVYYGLRVTNVYKGTGASLVITGWNSGPSKPEGDELDLTAILNNPAYASYYNATTKVFEKPATAAGGWRADMSLVTDGRAILTGTGAHDVTKSSGVMTLGAKVTAPDGVTRTSSPVSLIVRRPCTFEGPLNPEKTVYMLTGGVPATFTVRYHVPKYGGQKVGVFGSTDAYKKVSIGKGVLPSNGILSTYTSFDAGLADAMNTAMGNFGLFQARLYTGTEENPTLGRNLGTIALDISPDGGPANVPPRIQFGKRDAVPPVVLRWYSGSTPLSTVALTGYYGVGEDPNVRQDFGLRVRRSSIGSTLTLQIKNLKSDSQSGSAQYLLTGKSFDELLTPSFNELATTGNSATGSAICWGVQKLNYTGSDVTFSLPMDTIDAAFVHRKNPVELGFTLTVGAYDPVPNPPGNQYYLFRNVTLWITA